MGVYLNSTNAYTLYKGETTKPYFVDMLQKEPTLGYVYQLAKEM